MFGYMGKILEVDLSSQSIKDIPLNEKDLKPFVGGSGLACKIMLDRLGTAIGGIDPLSPENLLIFMTGPLTGTRVPNSGRFEVCAKSPLTNIWGEANCGGRFGPYLKFAGYDGIVIRGKAEKPVYLDVDNGSARLDDADHLWGKGTYETQEILKKDLGDKRMSVTVIGPVGEKLAPISCVMSDRGRAAGRCGMGAVMGSKNLKAIVARGAQKVEVENKEALLEVVEEASERMDEEVSTDMFSSLGTSGYMETAEAYGDSPVKYYTESTFEELEDIAGTKMNETVFKKAYGCYGCRISCGRVIETEDLGETEGPEYETLVALGSLCLNGDIDSIYKANHLCNDAGIDTISIGSTIAFAMYLRDKGVISREDTDGVDLTWGNSEAIVEMVEKTARREGFGDIISEGSRAMGKKYGKEEWTATVKGLEIPMHDSRGYFALASGYTTNNRGAVHVPEQLYQIEMGSPIEEYDIISEDRFVDEGKGIIAAKAQDYFGLFDAATICAFTWIRPTHLAPIFNYVTGFDYDIDSLLVTGERIFNTKRIFNNLCGIGKKDDCLPDIVLHPIEEGGTEGNVPDVEKQLKEYYEYRNWDWESGKPKKEKLKDLGLEKYASLIW